MVLHKAVIKNPEVVYVVHIIKLTSVFARFSGVLHCCFSSSMIEDACGGFEWELPTLAWSFREASEDTICLRMSSNKSDESKR